MTTNYTGPLKPLDPQPALNYLEVGCCNSDWTPYKTFEGGWDFRTAFEADNARGPWYCDGHKPALIDGAWVWINQKPEV